MACYLESSTPDYYAVFATVLLYSLFSLYFFRAIFIATNYDTFYLIYSSIFQSGGPVFHVFGYQFPLEEEGCY